MKPFEMKSFYSAWQRIKGASSKSAETNPQGHSAAIITNQISPSALEVETVNICDSFIVEDHGPGLDRSKKIESLEMRLDYIQEVVFPEGATQRLSLAFPHLNPEELYICEKGFREYAAACAIEGLKGMAMPSKAVDEVWHQLILHTQFYHAFCKKAFGTYLHHDPGVLKNNNKKVSDIPCVSAVNVDGSNLNDHSPIIAKQASEEEIARSWRGALRARAYWQDESTDVPLLFEMDYRLNIPSGIIHTVDTPEGERFINQIKQWVTMLDSDQ